MAFQSTIRRNYLQLEDILREIIEEDCEDYFFGVADLSLAKRSIIKQRESLINEYPKAISIGITVHPILINGLSMNHESSKTNYNKIIQQLNFITSRLSNLLQCEGYKTRFLYITNKSGDKKSNGFSHELVANLAGLGSIGNNGSLITPEVGSNILLGTVLTDAPL